MAYTMRYGDNTYSAKAIKKAKAKRRRQRKLGALEQRPTTNNDKVAGKPYRYTTNAFDKPTGRQSKVDYDGFYETREWIDLRYKVLIRYGARCMCCGRTKHDNVIIQVDHIRPRSKYPALALDIENLQVLCRDCNLGKSNTDETDWRHRTT